MKPRIVTLIAAGCCSMVSPLVTGTARADAVDDWYRHAVHAAVEVAQRPPAAAFIDLAIVQAAVRDASLAAGDGATAEVAAARAAHDVLVRLYPGQSAALDASLETTLSAFPDGSAKTRGGAAGRRSARAVLESRRGDGRDRAATFSPSPGRGVWSPTPPSFAPAQTPWVAHVRPFALASPDAHRPAPPPALDEPRYLAALDEVARRGARASSNRTPEETQQARFWSEHAASQYARFFTRLADQQRLGIADKVRLLADVHVAAADALIACFDAKYAYGFWRPVQAVTAAGPAWVPLLDTPNHPEYPSAHACLTEAVTRTLASFFGTEELATTADSAVTGTTRSYPTLRALADDVNESRILGGLHFRFSIDAGREIGRQVALDLERARSRRRTE